MKEDLPHWILARRDRIKRDADALCAVLKGRPVGSTEDDDEPVNFSDEEE